MQAGCESLVPLRCYYVRDGEIDYYEKPNICYTNRLSGDKRQDIMSKGCYVFITAPYASLREDLNLLFEWTSRLQINFAACRNVWSHVFTNNWVNGSLYMFPFKNERVFDNQNRPDSLYCKDTLHLDVTNNFYYRSSPFSLTSPGRFVGSPRPNAGEFLNISLPSYGGNDRNLKFPTTIVDLGPRNEYLQELIFSDEYDGYLANRLSETSYQDVSELLNLFIINRLTNKTFIDSLLRQRSTNVTTFFDRRGRLFVDGDYAQMISISSELGVVEFEPSSYLPIQNGQDPIFFNDANSSDPIFGIFFSSDSQTRDYLSPKRTIINGNISTAVQCGFNYFTSFSQIVPFYQWEIQQNQGRTGNSIFGSQSNDWYTNRLTLPNQNNPNTTYSSFFSNRYQSQDRILRASRYYRPSTSAGSTSQNFKGYIYSVNYFNPSVQPDYDPFTIGNTDPNNPNPNIYQVGAPYHFYFGLKKGKTAFDRFIKKWLDFNNIVE